MTPIVLRVSNNVSVIYTEWWQYSSAYHWPISSQCSPLPHMATCKHEKTISLLMCLGGERSVEEKKLTKLLKVELKSFHWYWCYDSNHSHLSLPPKGKNGCKWTGWEE